MSSHRFLFYAPSLAPEDDLVTIDRDEHHHLSRVLRMKPGETVFATNGAGLIVSGRVQDIGADTTVCSVVDVVSRTEGSRRVTLALALIAKTRFEQAFEQCVELGITECIPLVSANSQIKSYGSGFIRRLDRIALAAMKQSFRSTLPVVTPPAGFDEVVARCQSAANVVVGSADAPALSHLNEGGDVIVIVGPEAGLSGDETGALARAGAAFASTSRHRLRSETAAVTLVAAVAGCD